MSGIAVIAKLVVISMAFVLALVIAVVVVASTAPRLLLNLDGMMRRVMHSTGQT